MSEEELAPLMPNVEGRPVDPSATDYSLYLVTDRDLMSAPTLAQAVEEAIAGGVTLVQLREKHANSREFLSQARECKRICDAHGVPLLINDRLDIALACGAAGLHVGQDDLPVEVARQIIGPRAIIGVSASSVEQAVAAEQGGADYLGIGAMYATGTKDDATLVSHDELLAIRRAVHIPLVVIGGINAARADQFAHTGIDGFAVVSAIIAAADITAAAADLKARFISLDREMRQ